jgi:hypothetical protein
MAKPGPGVQMAKIAALRARARRLGASEFGHSDRANKKYFVVYRGRRVHFGAAGYEDFTIHRDKQRRSRYRARHSKVLTEAGTPAYKLKTSPAYWSWHLLW